MDELRATAADWQKQFHTLKDRIEALGLHVYYDAAGLPAIQKEPEC